MSLSALYRPHQEAPATVTLRALAAAPNRPLEHAFELVSRGDFVMGVIQMPDPVPSQPVPLILLTHGTGSAAESEALRFAEDWVGAGYAVARIDLPLHGRRSSPKLSERLVTGYRALARATTAGPAKAEDQHAHTYADTYALVEEFARQSVSDLVRASEALTQMPEIDADRVALVGLGIGAAASAWAAASVPFAHALVLAGEVGAMADRELDPAGRLRAGNGGPAPAMLFMPEAAQTTEREASTEACEALFEAAPSAKRNLDSTRSSGPRRETEASLHVDEAATALAFIAKTLKA